MSRGYGAAGAGASDGPARVGATAAVSGRWRRAAGGGRGRRAGRLRGGLLLRRARGGGWPGAGRRARGGRPGSASALRRSCPPSAAGTTATPAPPRHVALRHVALGGTPGVGARRLPPSARSEASASCSAIHSSVTPAPSSAWPTTPARAARDQLTERARGVPSASPRPHVVGRFACGRGRRPAMYRRGRRSCDLRFARSQGEGVALLPAVPWRRAPGRALSAARSSATRRRRALAGDRPPSPAERLSERRRRRRALVGRELRDDRHSRRR